MSAEPIRNPARGTRTRLIQAFLAVVVIAFGLAVLAVLLGTKPEPPRDPDPVPPVVVRTMTAVERPVSREHRGYGVVRAVRAVNIAAEIDGVVREKPARIEEGARVDRGELIVAIDPGDYRDRADALERNIEGVEAQLDLLRIQDNAAREQAALADEALAAIDREIERLRAAQERGAATANEIDQQIRARIAVARDRVGAVESASAIAPRRAQLEAQAASLRADAERARRDLERASIVSPIVGTIQEVDVEIGERVRIGDRVARVLDPTRLEVPLRLPLSAASDVRVGSPASLRADGPGGGEWGGNVVRVAPEADPDRRTITVYVEVEQDAPVGRAPDLPPGRFVLASVSAREASAVLLPRGAVSDDRVMVITNTGEIESRAVSVAYYTEGDFPELVVGESQWAVLASGLRAGETIAVSNLSKLHPGMRVEGVDAGEGATR